MLGNAGGDAPEGLWERIARELALDRGPDYAPPIPDLTSAMRSGDRVIAPITPIEAAPRSARRFRPVIYSLGTVAAALALVVGLLSARVSTLDNRVATIEAAVGATGTARAAALAAADPAHRTVTLTSSVGQKAAVLVVLPDGRAYLITEAGVSSLPADRSYQLWARVDGRSVSIGLLGRSPTDVAVQVTSNMTKFMVTIEPLGGTLTPTTPVVMQSPTISI
jgi:hypothetical protein